MPLKDFFEEQTRQLKAFMESPDEVVRLLLVNPDLRQPFLRLLSGMDQDPEFPHLLIGVDAPVHGYEEYLESLLEEVCAEFEKAAPELEDQGVSLRPENFLRTDLPTDRRVSRFLTDLAEALPDAVGSLVLVIEPSEVSFPKGYREAVLHLAEQVRSEWAKVLALENPAEAHLEGLEEDSERIGLQVFYLSPERIEEQAEEDLQKPQRLTPLERRQYTALLAGFAFARRDYGRAATLQRESLDLIEKDGTPAEAANGLYNLGNTHLAQGEAREAERRFAQAAEIALEQKIHGLAAMALTNLGIALHRQRKDEEAVESLGIARRTFKAQGNPAGEAHALDGLALIHHEKRDFAKAEEYWKEALEIYEGIDSKAMENVSTSGGHDIREKLDRLYRETGQLHKLSR